jgi:hypothetical protein
MLSAETNVPRSVVFGDADRCAQAIVDRVGYDLRLAVPVSIGKPILIIDALYRLAEADREHAQRISGKGIRKQLHAQTRKWWHGALLMSTDQGRTALLAVCYGDGQAWC